MNHIKQQFSTICKEAINAEEKINYSDCRVLEPYFIRIINLDVDASSKEQLIKCFKEVIWGEITAPQELLSYCMRALRYFEVLEESVIRLGEPPDPRWMDTQSDIQKAFDDIKWDEADFWRFQK